MGKKKQQKRAIRHRKKLKSLKTNEIRRILRMQIKTKLYKKFEVNAEPSEDEAESDENSKDESRHSNDTKEDESKDKTKEDNTSTLKDYESDVEDAKPKAKD